MTLDRDRRARRGHHFLRCALGLALVGLLAASCGSDGDAGDVDSGTVRVTAAFYPLAYLVGEVGGDRVTVTNLTSPGAEPHDLELTPDAVVGVVEADLVVYLSGFQPAVDDTVDQAGDEHVLDVRTTADLTRREGSVDDPHFWLDPQRFADVATAIADRLSALDPDGRTTYRSNSQRLAAELQTLDGEFRDGLAECGSTDLVTSHEAFGYLADRYGLRQVGISGLSPDTDPAPSALADVTRFVEDHNIDTVYFETLVSPAIAEAVADETGARTAVLDPVEGLTEASAGDDYLAVMRSNLSSLQSGLSCR